MINLIDDYKIKNGDAIDEVTLMKPINELVNQINSELGNKMDSVTFNPDDFDVSGGVVSAVSTNYESGDYIDVDNNNKTISLNITFGDTLTYDPVSNVLNVSTQMSDISGGPGVSIVNDDGSILVGLNRYFDFSIVPLIADEGSQEVPTNFLSNNERFDGEWEDDNPENILTEVIFVNSENEPVENEKQNWAGIGHVKTRDLVYFGHLGVPHLMRETKRSKVTETTTNLQDNTILKISGTSSDTLTLPPNPRTNDEIIIINSSGNTTLMCSVKGSGSDKVMNSANEYELSQNAKLIYVDDSFGWLVTNI